MNSRIAFISTAVILLFLSSCSGNFDDGLLYVNLPDLDLIQGFNRTACNINCTVKEQNGDRFTTVATSGFNGSPSSPISASLSFAVGNPDYVFTGGTVYYVDVQIDIDGNGDYTDFNLDYWLTEPAEIIVDGDTAISFDSSDFTRRF